MLFVVLIVKIDAGGLGCREEEEPPPN